MPFAVVFPDQDRAGLEAPVHCTGLVAARQTLEQRDGVLLKPAEGLLLNPKGDHPRDDVLGQVFTATARDGKADLGDDYNRERFKAFLKENDGVRLQITPVMPESRRQRGWFESAVIGLLTFYQEGMDHRDYRDRARVREWVKLEFNGEYTTVAGKALLTPKSTKGLLSQGLIDRVLLWLEEQYSPPHQALNPDEYKKWRDTVFPYGGPDNYIDYLVSTGILAKI